MFGHRTIKHQLVTPGGSLEAVPALWSELEGSDVGWAHDAEVPAVQCGDDGGTKPFCEGDNRGVHRAETEVRICFDQLSRPLDVDVTDVLHGEATRHEAAEKVPLDPRLGATRASR